MKHMVAMSYAHGVLMGIMAGVGMLRALTINPEWWYVVGVAMAGALWIGYMTCTRVQYERDAGTRLGD